MKASCLVGVFVSAWNCIIHCQGFAMPLTSTSNSRVGGPSHYDVAFRRRTHRQSNRLNSAVSARGVRGGLGIETEGMPRRLCGVVLLASRAPMLNEDDLSDMERAREEANRKVEQFLRAKTALKEAKLKEQRETNSAKIKQRVMTEREEAAQAKEYIPQRLQEIEREEALLQNRVTDFNAKIKDTDLKQL